MGASEAPDPGALVAARLEENSHEIAILSAMLRDLERKLEASAGNFEWLARLAAAQMKMPAWWGILPKAWRVARQRAYLARTGLFDAQAYLLAYPDVMAVGMDPLLHYIQHGMAEGRAKDFAEA